MELSDMFCIRWNDFTNNIADTFRSLRGDNDFTDVTLACEDGQVVEAHKVVLAASSPFFLDVLKVSKHPHPLIYLKGVQMRELAAVMDCLYNGEVTLVNQEELESFLGLAKDLRLKVVHDMTTDDDRESREVPNGTQVKVKELKKIKSAESGRQEKAKTKRSAQRPKLYREKKKDLYDTQTKEEDLESGELVNGTVTVQTGEAKSKARSAGAERQRLFRQRNKESVKVSELKYLRKTAEKRRADSDFDKEFREREAARKREWRKKNFITRNPHLS